MQQHTRLGRGSYSILDAARFAGLRTERLKRWTRGYSFTQTDGRPGSSPPIFNPDGRAGGHLTFLDLVEALFVKAFLDRGVTMPTIRKAARLGAEMYQVEHPFCLRRFETDGRGIFVRILDSVADEHLVDIVSQQAVFEKVVEPLLKQIDYDVASELAAAWWPRGRETPIVLDPARAFGAPVVAKRGVPTRMLAGPVRAGDSPEMVARWFDVPMEEVRAAVDFEESLLAA